MTRLRIGWFIIALSLPVELFALTLEWNRNTEPDMMEYRVYTCPTPGCTVVGANTIGVVPQTAVGIKPSLVLPANSSGMVAVLAIDHALNRSGLSVPLPFSTMPPDLPPAVPTGLLLK